MKRAGQWLLGLCFVLLFFLCAATLVEGPEAPVTAAPIAPPFHTAWAAMDEPAALQAQAAVERSTVSHQADRDCVQPRVAVRTPVCESNGRPLAEKSWAKTVYAACPPEGEAG